jgi:hypothetical protein
MIKGGGIDYSRLAASHAVTSGSWDAFVRGEIVDRWLAEYDVGTPRELAVSHCRYWAGLGFGPVSAGAEPGLEPSPLLRTRCGASGNLVKPTWTRHPD